MFRENNIAFDFARIRAAMSPSADAQMICIAWLENYFKVYGDSKPNKDEVLLNISFRNEV